MQLYLILFVENLKIDVTRLTNHIVEDLIKKEATE